MGTPARVTSFLYPKVEEEAHDCVKATIKIAEDLEKVYFKPENEPDYQNIGDLLDYFTVTSATEGRRKCVFRYFAAAVIYSQIMQQSFKSSKEYGFAMKYLNLISSTTENEDDLVYTKGLQELKESSTYNIEFLNSVAGDIQDELLNYACMQFKHENLEGKSPEDERKEKKKYLKDKRGRLSSKQAVGNAPFLSVHTSKKQEVSIRRGFELCRESYTQSKQIINCTEKLNDLPMRYSHNGIYQDNRSEGNQNLKSIIDVPIIREHIFKDKYVTFLHIEINDTNRYKTTIQVELIDNEIKGIQNDVTDQELEKLTGRKLEENKKEIHDAYKQEDLLITCFAEKLFSCSKFLNSLDSKTISCTETGKEEKAKEKEKILRQAFEVWSGEQIESFVKQESKMYIGFCFGTLLDMGYSSSNFVTGYRNVMLLALTRGFIKLYDNLTDENKHKDELEQEDRPGEDEEMNKPEERICFVFPKHIFKTKKEDKEPKTIVKEHILHGIQGKKIPYNNRAYIGSNTSGIIIRITSPPMSLLLIGTLFGIAGFGFGYLYYTSEKELKGPGDHIRAIGPIIELCGALLAFCFLFVKMIYRRWSFDDMFHSRKRCPSLKELIQAIKYSRNSRSLSSLFRANYKEDKIDAIKLCATIPKPESIFSYYNSCAFTDAGQGEFEIDEEIEMNELDEAGYIFGVNYHGDPIVKDAKGYIRRVAFRWCHKPECKEKCCCTAKKIHIGSNHNLQTQSIFQLSYVNRSVGTRKSYSLEHLL